MIRRLLAAITGVGFLFSAFAPQAIAASPGRPSVPMAVEPSSAVNVGRLATITIRLPGGLGAVEGRVIFANGSAELIGVAPAGRGTGLRPVQIDNGYAFGAFGLDSTPAETILHLVLNPLEEGTLQVRVAIDAASDDSGNRIESPIPDVVTSLVVGDGRVARGAPSFTRRPNPVRRPSTPRELQKDGRFDVRDLDSSRASWGATRRDGITCSSPSDGDVNSDGCVDIVDVQAVNSLKDLNAPRAMALEAAEAAARTFVVVSASDTPDASPGNGVCADSTGNCTLRAAITEAEYLGGSDRIEFNLPGTAPVRIQLTSRLPLITSRAGTLEIDGYTQPGSSPNTAAIGSNAKQGVELRGNGVAAHEWGLYITSPGNTIRGLLINNIYQGIFLDGNDARDNRIVGNWIGFQANGSPTAGQVGIVINTGSKSNRVGTPDLADRNVIGNSKKGIDSYGPGTDGNIIQNNLLCIRPDTGGTATCDVGIDHDFGPKGGLVGGFGPNERNIIGPTINQGIELSHGWNPANHVDEPKYFILNHRVLGNWVGFRADGSYDAAYRSGQNATTSDNGNGINVYDGASSNTIEGNYVGSRFDGIQFMTPNAQSNIARGNFIGISPLGQPAPLAGWGVVVRWGTRFDVVEGNTIANATKGGIGLLTVLNDGQISAPAYNIRITRNLVSNTNGPTIDLFGVAGPDPNDAGDADDGANTLLNSPVITAVSPTRVDGTGRSGATVEVYRASRPTGQYGLPTEYLGSAVVNAGGTWTLPIVLVGGGRLTALQILADGNTSELSPNVALPNTPPVINTVTISPAVPTTSQTVTAVVTSTDPDPDIITTTYQWARNGVDIAGATGSTLNLATAGNGNRGDQITVRATVNDGTVSSAPMTSAPVTIANTVPVATVVLSPNNPGTSANLTATATRTDPDGDAVTLTYVWKVNGTIRRTTTATSALTDVLNLGIGGNGDPGDTVSVEVTPNDGFVGGATVSASQVVVAGATVYASDQFSRTVSNGWGTANYGGSYTPLGTFADFSVASGTGRLNLGSAGVLRSASLTGVSVRDFDISFRVTTNKSPAGGTQYLYGIVRRISDVTAYRVKLRIPPGGAVYMQASSVVNDVETNLGSEVQVPGLTLVPNSFIWLRAQLTGVSPTTIRIRAWSASASEPSTWPYSVTNSASALQVPGGVGLMAYLGSGSSNAPLLVSFDDLVVTGIEGGPNTPPVVDTVTVAPTSPTTAQLLTATVTSHDADGHSLTTAYQWTRNGTDIPGASTATLDMALAGNGDRGDLIRVRATVSDGAATSAPVTSASVTVINSAPVFSTEFTDRSDAEGAVISFDSNAADADGTDTLTYSATNLPNGITINSSTGVVSGTLSGTSSGSYAVVLTVSDGTLTDTDSFTWTVTEPNVAPVFSTEFTDRTDPEGAVISFDANASDANPGDTLTYSATNLPNGIMINASTGVVSGTLSGTSSGSYAVVLTVSDGTLTDTDSFTWTVTEPAVNVAPVFSTEFTDRSDDEGTVVSFDANASDANPGDTLTYSSTDLPDGISIDSSTGVVSGTLSSSSSGVYGVVLTVSDGTLTDTDSFTWTVTEPAANVAPVFSTEFTDRSDDEGTVVSGFDADATDANGGTLTYSATDLPDGISINPSTGVVSGTLSGTSAGSYAVVLTVSDGSLTDTDSFTWTVTEPAVNVAPVFSTEFTDRSDDEGDVISFDADASDANAGDTLTYSATDLPDGISIDSSTGVVSGTLSGTSLGVYAVVLTVSDGTLTDTDSFTWTVTEPGSAFSLDFDGSDDHVTFGAATSSLGLQTFTIETWFRRDGAGTGTGTGSGGIASAIPLVTKGRSENDTPANINANWFLGIDATSGVLVADFEDNATGLNHPVTGVTAIPPTGGGWHHAAVTYDTATDTWNLYLDGVLERNLPAGGNFTPESLSIQHAALGTAINSTGVTSGFFDGVLDEVRIWNVARTGAQISANRNVELTSGTGLVARYGLDEGAGTSVASSVAGAPTGTAVGGPLWVPGIPFGGAPEFSTEFTDRSDAEGTVISGFDANATDPNGDTLTYSATNLPSGISIDSATGVVSGTLSGTSSGVHAVVLTVSDGTLTDTDSFTWTVTEPNVAPVFSTEFTDRTDAEGAVISFDADASDANPGDSLTYSASNLPNGIAINASTGVVSGTLSGTSSGSYNVVLTVSDGALTDTDSFTWTVTEPVVNVAPVFSTEFTNRTDPEGTVISFDANASDANPGDTLTYSATNLPNGITINSGTGVVSGTLSGTSSGSYAVVLTVSDGSLTDTDSFTWTVTEPNVAPVFSTEFTNRTDPEGTVISGFDANASDANPGDTLTYSATNLPNGISINASTGVVSGTLSGTSSGSYAVVLTVSDGTLTDTDSFTWTVTEPSVTVYADDQFNRTVVNNWGSAAPTGGAYTLSGTAADFDVTGAVGTFTMTPGANRSAALAGVSALNAELSFTVSTNKLAVGGFQYVYGIGRRINATTEYRVKVRLGTNGSVAVQGTAVVNNVETNIGAETTVPGLTHTANGVIRVRAQISGTNPTTIRIRAWADSSPEPSTWTYTATNSTAGLQVAGGVGLRSYISGATANAPVVVSFDAFRVTSIAP